MDTNDHLMEVTMAGFPIKEISRTWKSDIYSNTMLMAMRGVSQTKGWKSVGKVLVRSLSCHPCDGRSTCQIETDETLVLNTKYEWQQKIHSYNTKKHKYRWRALIRTKTLPHHAASQMFLFNKFDLVEPYICIGFIRSSVLSFVRSYCVYSGLIPISKTCPVTRNPPF